MVTRPAAMSSSLARREAIPAAARIFWRRSRVTCRAWRSVRLELGRSAQAANLRAGRIRVDIDAGLGQTGSRVDVDGWQDVEGSEAKQLDNIDVCHDE